MLARRHGGWSLSGRSPRPKGYSHQANPRSGRPKKSTPTYEAHPSAVLLSSNIGAGTKLGPGVVVGEGVKIGKHVVIGFNVSLSNCEIGDNVIIHHGVCIGQDGFGFIPTAEGIKKKPQLLSVHIADNVEIGANTCIDRGSWRPTTIGEGTKLDNLVQVGHNAQIGRQCLIAAQCGIAGSVTMGDHVQCGGQVGIKDHVIVGDRARIAAKSGVLTNVPPGATYGGYPAVPIRVWHRQTVFRKRQAASGLDTSAQP